MTDLAYDGEDLCIVHLSVIYMHSGLMGGANGRLSTVVLVPAGPLPPGKTAGSITSKLPKAPKLPRVPKTFRRAAPAVPESASVPPEAPPSPPQQSLQTFIPKLNRYIQAKVNRVPGEVRAEPVRAML